MKYQLKDGQGTLIARGNQLALCINVDLENDTLTVRHGANVTQCDIANGDKFTLSFTHEVLPGSEPTYKLGKLGNTLRDNMTPEQVKEFDKGTIKHTANLDHINAQVTPEETNE